MGCATLRNRAEIPLPQAVHPFSITQSRKGAKKRLARSVIAQSYFGDDAIVAGIEGEITPPRHGGAVGVAEQQRDHAKHGGGAPAGLAQSRGHGRPQALRQYNLTQRRRGAKKVLARAVIVQSYFGDDADVTGIHSFVILNLFQDNEPRPHVILKQVQDDELWGEEIG